MSATVVFKELPFKSLDEKHAYFAEVFGTESGARVLSDLALAAELHKATQDGYDPASRMTAFRNDPREEAYILGKQDMVNYINAIINTEVKHD